MSEAPGHSRDDNSPDVAPLRRSPFASTVRIAIELSILFGVALLAKHVLPLAASGAYPNPLWLPVIVISLLHGHAAGLAAALIATALQFAPGLPPQLMSEDMYSHIGRIATEPVGWIVAAFLIGHMRSRQLANLATLQAELGSAGRRCAEVADHCADLRTRTEMLERQIAANAHASNLDIAEAVTALNEATFDNFGERLTRFVILMTSAAEFSIHLIRDGTLEVVFRPADDHRCGGGVPSGHPVFAAVVQDLRILSVARDADAALLGDLGTLAAPLLDVNGRAMGMLVVGSASPDDHPDIERRLALTAAEIARLIGRIAVIDRWQAAATTSRANGNGREQAASHAPERAEPTPTFEAVAAGTRPRPERTLQ